MTQPVANDKTEKRNFDRKELLTEAIFVSSHQRLKSALTIDISTHGLSLTVPQAITVGEACAVSFDVPDDDGSKQRALVHGHIASCVPFEGGYRVGIKHLESDPISRQLIAAAVDHHLKKA